MLETPVRSLDGPSAVGLCRKVRHASDAPCNEGYDAPCDTTLTHLATDACLTLRLVRVSPCVTTVSQGAVLTALRRLFRKAPSPFLPWQQDLSSIPHGELKFYPWGINVFPMDR